MKTYNVTIETKSAVVTEFSINASCKKEALQTAQAHKRWENYKGRVSVRFIK